MTDIEAHVGGKVAKHLLPYLTESHPNQLTTVKALLDHLEESYKDKEHFKDKLSGKLPSTLPAYLDDNVSFDQYVKLCTQLAHQMHISNKKRDAKRKTNQSTPSGSANRSTPRNTRSDTGNASGRAKNNRNSNIKTSNDANRTPTTKGRNILNSSKLLKLARKGKCFNCQQKGHVSRDCPLNGAEKEARLQTIVATFVSSRDKAKTSDDVTVEGAEETETPKK
ncbi:hypothetical protein GGS24DRAFT_517297 [Hypoxylon argillaceum]|nr:hypothetical protein GGS24DRAFT_517297 [Hypoxylon argillaceum]